MNASVKGCLDALDRCWRSFQHNGKPMSKEEVKAVLEYADGKGYEGTDALTDEEIDNVIKSLK